MVGATGSEDPATGSASGPLGCYLVRHGLVPASAAGTIDQRAGREDGTAQPHPHPDRRSSGQDITRVQVGGTSVLVGDGRLRGVGRDSSVPPTAGAAPHHAARPRRAGRPHHGALDVAGDRRAARRRSCARVRDHDDGWREPDAAPTIDPATGAVLDFVGVPAAVKQDVWPRCLAGLADAPWAAALVAHHAIYGLRPVSRRRWRGRAFFARMEAARAQPAGR